MFPTIFLLVNMHYQMNGPDEAMQAYRTRELCMEQIRIGKEEAAKPEYGSSAKSNAGFQCIPYRLDSRLNAHKRQ